MGAPPGIDSKSMTPVQTPFTQSKPGAHTGLQDPEPPAPPAPMVTESAELAWLALALAVTLAPPLPVKSPDVVEVEVLFPEQATPRAHADATPNQVKPTGRHIRGFGATCGPIITRLATLFAAVSPILPAVTPQPTSRGV